MTVLCRTLGAAMKILWKIVGGLLVCLIVLLGVLRITGLPPNGRRPGLWIKGNPVAAPVSDWSWTDQYPYIELQTRTWYLLPHSVTINCLRISSKFPPYLE
jgi:hypothetical protein